jgi:2-phosphoglycerate kinase
VILKMDEIQVTKRDGGMQPWSSDKLIASIGKAGVPVAASQNIAAQIVDWAKGASADGKVSSDAIRDKVIEIMSSEYPAESDNYKTYKKQ